MSDEENDAEYSDYEEGEDEEYVKEEAKDEENSKKEYKYKVQPGNRKTLTKKTKFEYTAEVGILAKLLDNPSFVIPDIDISDCSTNIEVAKKIINNGFSPFKILREIGNNGKVEEWLSNELANP